MWDDDASEGLRHAETELENNKLLAEVERLRAVEKAREEERGHSHGWAEDLERGFVSRKILGEDCQFGG